MTPVELVAGHVVYGIALALLYGWIASMPEGASS